MQGGENDVLTLIVRELLCDQDTFAAVEAVQGSAQSENERQNIGLEARRAVR